MARVLREGQPAVEVSRSLIIPATPWLGSRLGLEEGLPPWTPLKLSGSADRPPVTIGCSGRAYEFHEAWRFPRRSSRVGEKAAGPSDCTANPPRGPIDLRGKDVE